MRDHPLIDQRSLAMHQCVAQKIRQDPALFDKVCGTLARWRATVSPAAQPYLEVWQQAVDQGMEACLALAVEDSARATALRQSSPFAGVLTPAERFGFLRSWNSDHATP